MCPASGGFFCLLSLHKLVSSLWCSLRDLLLYLCYKCSAASGTHRHHCCQQRISSNSVHYCCFDIFWFKSSVFTFTVLLLLLFLLLLYARLAPFASSRDRKTNYFLISERLCNVVAFFFFELASLHGFWCSKRKRDLMLDVRILQMICLFLC